VTRLIWIKLIGRCLMPARAGFSDKAVEITLDIEQPLYEASTLLKCREPYQPHPQGQLTLKQRFASQPRQAPCAFAGSGSCRR